MIPALSTLAAAYTDDPTPDAFKALSCAAEPKRQELLRRLTSLWVSDVSACGSK
jgi:hypothetical protein